MARARSVAAAAGFAPIAVACGGSDGSTDERTGPDSETESTAAPAPATDDPAQDAVVAAREAGEATGQDTREVQTGPAHGGRAETCGFMFSMAWLETLPNNPFYVSPSSPLTNEEKAAARANATGDPSAPVGLGPFKFVSYTPGNGNSLLAERNPDYWRGPNGITGEELPYLDEIEFVVAVDIQDRSNGLKAGQFDMIHTSNADEVSKYEGDSDFVTLQANDYGETNYSLINVASGVNPVLAFLRGTDAPIPMDPLGLNATNDGFNVESNELMVSMWTDVFGDELAFGRFQDPEIDAAFQEIRHNPDPAARQAAAEEVNRAFGRNVWNLWSHWTLWGIIANPRVQNITDLSIPGNVEGSFPVISGKHHLTQIWCTDGDCQG
ncbi:ABC transporter substrate-binding protein [Candidatus Poriferisodalis sp.]|uniref:ABC transporter substrate-binding protein n=1 Tax=Candidatus Poriferisodalis sp. TaxID=3101277 RepID=UPI003C6F08CD